MKSLTIHDFDGLFHSLKVQPIILNDVPAQTKEERETLNRLIMTTYNNTDTLESIPMCSCGHMAHGYNLGVMCPYCGTRVEATTDREIESTVWLRAPDGIKSLVSPLLWMVLSKVMTTSKFNVLTWFCNPNAEYPPIKNRQATKLVKKLEKLKVDKGIVRGLNSFHDNFEMLIPAIISAIPAKGSKREDLANFMTKFRKLYFPHYLPMPNKMAFVMEVTATGTYTDIPAIREAIDAARTITSLDAESLSNIRRLEGKVTSVLDSLAKYYFHMFGDPFSKKEGWLRQTVYGTRMGFSFRSVITSGGVSTPEDYETIQIPYPQAVTMFKVHLLNKLNKEGYNYLKAWEYIDQHTQKRDPLLERLLYELFKEAPGGDGVWALFIRYPTLARASIQALRINGVRDNSTTLHVMVVAGPNADFDGDQLSGCIALSNEMIEDFSYFRPHYGIHSFSRHRRFNNNMKLPDVDIDVLTHLLEWEEDQLGVVHA